MKMFSRAEDNLEENSGGSRTTGSGAMIYGPNGTS